MRLCNHWYIYTTFENSVIPAWMPESSHKDVNLYKTLPTLVLDTRIPASMTICVETYALQFGLKMLKLKFLPAFLVFQTAQRLTGKSASAHWQKSTVASE